MNRGKVAAPYCWPGMAGNPREYQPSANPIIRNIAPSVTSLNRMGRTSINCTCGQARPPTDLSGAGTGLRLLRQPDRLHRLAEVDVVRRHELAELLTRQELDAETLGIHELLVVVAVVDRIQRLDQAIADIIRQPLGRDHTAPGAELPIGTRFFLERRHIREKAGALAAHKG